MRGLIKLLVLTSLALPASAHNLNIAWGRIVLVDLGSLIKSEPLIGDDSLVRVYPLSGLNAEDDRSILAIQGIAETGSTDLSVNTEAGIIQLHITLGSTSSPDLILNSQRSRLCVSNQVINMSRERSLILETDSPINEYLLASRPNLFNLKQLVAQNDPKYFSSAVLQSKASGISDIVVATKSRVYKFTINTGGQNNEHTEHLKLSANSCKR